MIERFEKLFGKDDGREESNNDTNEPVIDPDSGVVLTPEEIKKQQEIREGDPNWFREQK